MSCFIEFKRFVIIIRMPTHTPSHLLSASTTTLFAALMSPPTKRSKPLAKGFDAVAVVLDAMLFEPLLYSKELHQRFSPYPVLPLNLQAEIVSIIYEKWLTLEERYAFRIPL